MTFEGRFKIVDVPLSNGAFAKGLLDSDNQKQSPVVVDFNSASFIHRLRNGANGEAVVKAMGVKQSLRDGLVVADLTAGLGTDAFLLAHSGFAVVGFERDPLLYALLEDGLKRYMSIDSTTLSLKFVFGDSTDRSTNRSGELGFAKKPFAVLLDPMFEVCAISAKSQPKKQMASLRALLRTSSAQEVELLFQTAIEMATDRVVVKRPVGAPPLVSLQLRRPSNQLEGKSARFDIYSCR